MENYPINLQVKEGVIHKIRPGVWYSERVTDYAIFDCLEDFISAIEETTFKEPRLRSSIASTWLTVFQRNYKAWCGEELSVPRWNDIKDKYDLVTDKKREKAREKLELAIFQKQKIEGRVLKYQQSIIEAKTDKQKQKAEQGLKKAMSSLETALKKVADAQAQYDAWIN